MITLIAAIDTELGIGKDGGIPWNLPEDSKFFQQETIGGACIMGRKTFESLKAPLRDRLNIVVSSSVANVIPRNTVFTHDVDSAIRLAKEQAYTRIYAIGGRRIYSEMNKYAQRMLLTEVNAKYNCDVFFPDVLNQYEYVARYTLSPKALVKEYLK